MTPSALADFRSRLPDCELVVFADIGSRTVLGSDGALRYPQEHLDALCDTAAELFRDGPDLGAGPVEHVMFVSATGSRVFLRAANSPREALCCIGAPAMDFTVLLAEGRAALAGNG